MTGKHVLWWCVAMLVPLAVAEHPCPALRFRTTTTNPMGDDAGRVMGPGRRMLQEQHHHSLKNATEKNTYYEALEELNFDEVEKDILAVLTNSQESWPADFHTYGPLMIRLAWHCSGSYRSSDGRGGCRGGRIRFEPERSWKDNTNLDKALTLLEPVKQKHGLGLSWGDLIVLTGTIAIKSMGGPVLGFCAGRVDDRDGSTSTLLGPSPEQVAHFACPVNGQCESPLGASEVELIYVNPEGYLGIPDPVSTARNVRDVFARMGMNDSETVALTGGGHAFGKVHGPCPDGPGEPPNQAMGRPWAGACGTGKGADTYTSGFEGSWTTTPTNWTNQYFRLLRDNEWEKHEGPGGRVQWQVREGPMKDFMSPPAATGSSPERLMMLTTDISFKFDPEGKYQQLINDFADNQDKLDHAFKYAWYKLVTRDMGPASRCVGPRVPDAQPWQFPLPSKPGPPTQELLKKAKAKVDKAIRVHEESNGARHPDTHVDGDFRAQLIRLAWQCASTFRTTDFLGGCNGARIRFPPEKDWPANQGLDRVLAVLQKIHAQFENKLSWADLIVLSGTQAVEDAGVPRLHFCPGRTDAPSGDGSEALNFTAGSYPESDYDVQVRADLMGLSKRALTALNGQVGWAHSEKHNPLSWTNVAHGACNNSLLHSFGSSRIDNDYFKTVLSETWQEFTDPCTRKVWFKAKGKEIYVVAADLVIRNDPELRAIAQEYASDNRLFLHELAHAWTKAMNADRFDGPVKNVCAVYS